MATVAGGLLMDNIVMFTFGKEPRRFTLEAVDHRLELFGTGVDLMQLIIPAVVAAIVNEMVTVGCEAVLGLDDYHLVTNPDVHRSVERLVSLASAPTAAARSPGVARSTWWPTSAAPVAPTTATRPTA